MNTQPCRSVAVRTILAAALAWTQAVFAAPATSIYNQPTIWTDDSGQQVQLSRWNGTPVIIAMAYTECTRICNATLHRLEEAQKLADQTNAKVDIIVVSFDPSIDNPSSWTYYRKQHNLVNRSNWHFLTASAAATKRLANQLGIVYWLDEDHVMHDLKITYINPDGSIKTYLDWDHQDVARLFK